MALLKTTEHKACKEISFPLKGILHFLQIKSVFITVIASPIILSKCVVSAQTVFFISCQAVAEEENFANRQWAARQN